MDAIRHDLRPDREATLHVPGSVSDGLKDW
jgi:hypothetical protein